MARTPIWKSITATLEREIAEGLYPAGEKLPTEAALSLRFGVNRHTVRRALADMAERGLVHARRGAGVFVEAGPTDYPIGRRVRFHQNIRATGGLPAKRVIRVETRPARHSEADDLSLSPGDPVVIYEGVSLSKNLPVAHFESAFPLIRLPGIAKSLGDITSVTAALAENGVADYLRTETRLTAERATATQALHLKMAEGDPLLRSVSVSVTPDGVPIERGSTWFAGDRVRLLFAHD